MTNTTISETLFESLCMSRRIRCERILVTNNKTPDFVITLGAQRVVVEVKQLDPNKEDNRVEQALSTTGTDTCGIVPPTARVRKQIASGYDQLKAAAREGEAC